MLQTAITGDESLKGKNKGQAFPATYRRCLFGRNELMNLRQLLFFGAAFEMEVSRTVASALLIRNLISWLSVSDHPFETVEKTDANRNLISASLVCDA